MPSPGAPDPPRPTRIFPLIAVLFSVLISLIYPLVRHSVEQSNTPSFPDEALTNNMSEATASRPLPTYFLGIGGPNFIENTKHPAYLKLAEIGKEITTKVKPKAVVVFSAHWQEGPSAVAINAVEHTDLIYDFYGFPPHYYEIKYPNKGSPEVANKVIQRLTAAGIHVNEVKRGLDHGVWVGFLAGM